MSSFMLAPGAPVAALLHHDTAVQTSQSGVNGRIINHSWLESLQSLEIWICHIHSITRSPYDHKSYTVKQHQPLQPSSSALPPVPKNPGAKTQCEKIKGGLLAPCLLLKEMGDLAPWVILIMRKSIGENISTSFRHIRQSTLFQLISCHF